MAYSSGKIKIPNVTGNIVITVKTILAKAKNILLESFTYGGKTYEPVGFLNNTNLSTSGTASTVNGLTATNSYVPCEAKVDTIYLKGFEANNATDNGNTNLIFYDENKTVLTGQFFYVRSHSYATLSDEGNGIFKLTVAYSGCKYVRFNLPCANGGANAVITINQPPA
jgi:hypothetical protein